MATVQVPVEWARWDRFPMVCARSGKPATKHRNMEVYGDVPSSASFFILLGLLPYLLIARSMARTKFRIHLPLSNTGSPRRTAYGLGALGAFLGMFVVVAIPNENVAAVVALACIVALIWLLILFATTEASARPKNGVLVMKHVHPTFVSAVESAVSQWQQGGAPTVGGYAPATVSPPAGWVADPSGRFQLRYWDGQQWTEHVSTDGQQSISPVG